MFSVRGTPSRTPVLKRVIDSVVSVTRSESRVTASELRWTPASTPTVV